MRKLLRAAQTLLAASLALAGCGLFGGHEVHVAADLRAGSATVHVEAKLSGGNVVAAEADGPAPDVEGLKAAANPIRLSVRGGELMGTATLRFPVDNPHAVVLTRSDLTHGHWVWAGGEYDAVSRTISVVTHHFSDWVPAITSPDEIAANLAEYQQRKGHVDTYIVGKIFGDTPPLACPSSLRLVTAEIVDDGPPYLQVCLALDTTDGKYHLEIANPHDYPLLLALPPAVKAEPEAGGDGVVEDVWATLRERSTGKTLLKPETKRVFEVDKATLAQNNVITGKVDWWAFTVDMSLMTLDLAGKGAVKAAENAGRKELAKGLEQGLQSKDFADCVDLQAGKMPDALSKNDDSSTDNATDLVLETGAKCMDPLFDGGVPGYLSGIGVEPPKKKSAWSYVKDRLGDLLDLPSLFKSLREEIAGLITAAEHAIAHFQHIDLTAKITLTANAPDNLAGVDWSNHIAKCNPDAEAQGLHNVAGKHIAADVTGDGYLDTLVVTSCASTTSSNPDVIEVFDGSSSAQSPRRLGFLLKDDENWIRGAAVTVAPDGTISIVGNGVSPTGALANPDETVRYQYKWNGTMFTTTGPKVTPCPDAWTHTC